MADNVDRKNSRQRDHALFKSIAGGVGSRAISLAALAGSYAALSRFLDPLRFGVVATLTALVALAVVADFGIGAALITKIASARTAGERMNVSRIVAATIVVIGFTSFCIVISGAGVAALADTSALLGAHELPEEEVDAAVIVFALGASFALPGGVGVRLLYGVQKGFTASVMDSSGAVLGLICVLGAGFGDLPIAWHVASLALVPFIPINLVTAHLLWRQKHFPRPRLGQVQTSSLQALARLGTPFFVINLAMVAAVNTDTLIVAMVRGADEAATLAVLTRLYAVVRTTLARALQQTWASSAEAAADGEFSWIRSRYWRVLWTATLVASLASVLITLQGPSIVSAWVGEAYVGQREVYILLAVWTVYSVGAAQVSYLLNGAGIVNSQAVMFGGMAIVNLVLSWALAARVGLVGPVIASLATHALLIGLPSLFLSLRYLAKLGQLPDATPRADLMEREL